MRDNGKFAFLMVPDRGNTTFPVRTGNYRDAQIFDCIILEGQKYMVRRQVILEEVIMEDYLGKYEDFTILMGKSLMAQMVDVGVYGTVNVRDEAKATGQIYSTRAQYKCTGQMYSADLQYKSTLMS